MYDSHLGPNTMLDGLEADGQTFAEMAQSAAQEMQVPTDVTSQESWQTEAVDAGSSLIRSLISTVTAPLTKSSDKPLVKQPPAQLPSDPATPVATTNTQPVAKAELQPAPAPGPGMSQGMRTALMIGLLGGIGFLGYRMLAKPKKRGRRRKRR